MTLGTTLRSARASAGMSVEDAAHQLRMSTWQITALEEENLAVLTTPAFVRGFIRNYAKLLKLDPEPLLTAYLVLQPEQAQQTTISLHSEHIAISDGSKKTWLLYALASFLVVVAGSGWLLYKEWGVQKTQKTAAAAIPKMPEIPPTQPLSPSVEQVTALPPVTAPVESIAEPVVTTSAPAVAAQPSSLATAASPVLPTASDTDQSAHAKKIIRMTFSEETWVSIVDSTGKEIFNKTKAAGSEDAVDGLPPFQITIGNVNGTALFYRDKPYDLAPHTKANVARLKLE